MILQQNDGIRWCILDAKHKEQQRSQAFAARVERVAPTGSNHLQMRIFLTKYGLILLDLRYKPDPTTLRCDALVLWF